jgi:lipopolysaccharide/colanic/teichoic acid biosynthesis glycosyltransferase
LIKRSFDVLVSFSALILVSPLLILLSVLIRINLGRSILFVQDRPGLNGRLFPLIKFRTMVDARDDQGQSLPDSVRLTPFGKWLRASSLDELPELWNVLRGDMSLVGPRPLLVQYLPLYSIEQARRHDVRPGITGWAQVNGRNALTWNEKFALDIWYVDNQSFWLDIGILVRTTVKVFAREGISADGEVTMPPFEGNS